MQSNGGASNQTSESKVTWTELSERAAAIEVFGYTIDQLRDAIDFAETRGWRI